MSYSYTATETWSRTHARKVGGKVAADLRQMQQEYGLPTDHQLEQYLDELVILLTDGYLDEVTYGYQKQGAWIAAMRYTADMNGNLTADDRSGQIPRGVNIAGSTWGSFLIKSAKWRALPESTRISIEGDLPFKRDTAAEPTDGAAVRYADKTYSSARSGLRRSTIGGNW